MHKTIFIMDGYNVIHKITFFREKLKISLEKAREALIAFSSSFCFKRNDIDEFYIVFDGTRSQTDKNQISYHSKIKIIFSQTKKEADDLIIDILRQKQNSNTAFYVVTDDNYISNNVRSFGGSIIRSSEFYSAAETKTKIRYKAIKTTENKTSLPPDKQNSITNELKKLWGNKF